MTAMSKTLFRKSTVCQAPCWGLCVLWIGRKKIFKKETEVENFGLLPARQRMQRWGGVGRGEVRLEGSVGNKESSKAVWWGGRGERNRRLVKHLRQRGPSPRKRTGGPLRAQLEGFTAEVTEGEASELRFGFQSAHPPEP